MWILVTSAVTIVTIVTIVTSVVTIVTIVTSVVTIVTIVTSVVTIVTIVTSVVTKQSLSRIDLEVQKSMLVNGATIVPLTLPTDNGEFRLTTLKAQTPRKLLYHACGCK